MKNDRVYVVSIGFFELLSRLVILVENGFNVVNFEYFKLSML